jgi:hypothetical protein
MRGRGKMFDESTSANPVVQKAAKAQKKSVLDGSSVGISEEIQESSLGFGPLLQRIHKFMGSFRMRSEMRLDWIRQWEARPSDMESEEECCAIWDEVVLNEPFWAGSDSPFMNTNTPVASFVRNMESGKLPMEFGKRRELARRSANLPTPGKISKEYRDMVHSWYKADYIT